MKKRTIISLMMAMAMLVLLGSCEHDNLDAPDCRVYGHITYEGQRIGLKSTNSTIQLELWQNDFGLEKAQIIYVNQEGAFSTYAYKGGHLRIVAKPGSYPWKNTQDTVYIDNIKGNHEFNYEVYPYYMIENVEYSLADGVITADFDIKEIYSEKSIAQAGIVVNRTQFVDLSTAIKASGTKQNPGHVTLKMDISKELESEKALFCRVFTKIDGIDEALYSPDPYKLK